MIDIQNEEDARNIPLKRVGVKGVQYPVTVLDKACKTQETVATVDLFVNLPHNFKGTHMSRFIEIFHEYHSDLTMQKFLEMLRKIEEKLHAERAEGSVTFPYYIEKAAPVTGVKSISRYECSYSAVTEKNNEINNISKNAQDKKEKFFVTVKVPIATLCPCSKAISDYGAHNQRGVVTVKVLYKKFFWIEDIITLVESSASSPLYTALKRKDEKFVTESAYNRPRFVEDVVREVYQKLTPLGVDYFSIEAETFESIHSHNAFASTEYKKGLLPASD